MRLKRIAAWIGIVAGLALAMPAAGVAGLALWQKAAPQSLRAVILTAAEMTDPSRLGRAFDSLGIAEGGTTGGRG